MSDYLKNTKEAISKGNNPIKEAFKLGFIACIQSLEDKGYNELATTLKHEHSQL